MSVQTTGEKRPGRWREPFEAWLDGIEAGWAIPLLLAGFACVWTLFLVIAYTNADLHPDVLEAWSVGRGFSLGNAKHPPLMGWIANLWTTVFPLTDWSFQLLAMLNAALALWCVDLIARRFVSGDKRAIVLLLAMLLPAYQFHAQRLNANTVLLATWPLAIYCFLRAFETRTIQWSIAAGVACALAMLGKYYSVFLIVAFIFAAVVHPQRRAYLRSASPWISTFAGFVALAPHLYWLATTGAVPFEYASQSHGSLAFEPSTHDAFMFVLGTLAYLVVPAVMWVSMIRSSFALFGHDLRNLNSGLQLLLLVLIATIVAPFLVALFLKTDMPSLWNLQGVFLAILIPVCCTHFPIARFDTVNLAATMLVFSLSALALSPLHAIYRNTHAFSENRHFLRAAAVELSDRWDNTFDRPLKRISGSDELAFAVAFYGSDHPVYSRPYHFQYQWPLPRPESLDAGWAAMCFTTDSVCVEWLAKVEAMAPEARRTAFPLRTSLWGSAGVSSEVTALMIPPRSGVVPDRNRLLHEDGVQDLTANRRKQRRPGGRSSRKQIKFTRIGVVSAQKTS